MTHQNPNSSPYQVYLPISPSDYFRTWVLSCPTMPLFHSPSGDSFVLIKKIEGPPQPCHHLQSAIPSIMIFFPLVLQICFFSLDQPFPMALDFSSLVLPRLFALSNVTPFLQFHSLLSTDHSSWLYVPLLPKERLPSIQIYLQILIKLSAPFSTIVSLTYSFFSA